jgi:hypothetical protein
MADSLKTLAGIQDQVAKTRRLALETKDKEASGILYQLADEPGRVPINRRRRPLCSDPGRLSATTAANVAMGQQATLRTKLG